MLPRPDKIALVLDLDGTLIATAMPTAEQPWPDVTPRPHLQEFLQWAREHFHPLCLWSAANSTWVSRHYHDILKPLFALGQDFDIIWSQEDCILVDTVRHAVDVRQYVADQRLFFPRLSLPCGTTLKSAVPEPKQQPQRRRDALPRHCYLTKPLRQLTRVIRDRFRMQCDENSVLLVDDSPASAIFNRDNLVLVPNYGGRADDEWLKRLREYLELVIENYEQSSTVLSSDKIGWPRELMRATELMFTIDL